MAAACSQPRGVSAAVIVSVVALLDIEPGADGEAGPQGTVGFDKQGEGIYLPAVAVGAQSVDEIVRLRFRPTAAQAGRPSEEDHQNQQDRGDAYGPRPVMGDKAKYVSSRDLLLKIAFTIEEYDPDFFTSSEEIAASVVDVCFQAFCVEQTRTPKTEKRSSPNRPIHQATANMLLPATPSNGTRSMPKPSPKKQPDTDMDFALDAWERFEKLVKLAAEIGPRPTTGVLSHSERSR